MLYLQLIKQHKPVQLIGVKNLKDSLIQVKDRLEYLIRAFIIEIRNSSTSKVSNSVTAIGEPMYLRSHKGLIN